MAKARTLTPLERELIGALKHAVKCAKYCRRNHKDSQIGDGVPAELFWEELIARAEAHR